MKLVPRSLRKKIWFVVGLLLIFAESIPHFHLDEQDHACFEQGNHYFSFDARVSVPRSTHELDSASLIPVELGERHFHHECALCRLGSYQILPSIHPHQVSETQEAYSCASFFHSSSSLPGSTRSRAPPVSSFHENRI